MEVERLVQLTYPGKNHPLIDNIKTETFVGGIDDPDIKLAVCSMQKTTFGERKRPLAQFQDHQLAKCEKWQ